MADTTDISICTAALLLVGADEINSFSDDTREAKVCGELYPMLLEDLLTTHPWHFTKKMVQLSRLASTPLFDYQYAFQLPTDMLQLSKIELAAPYEIYEDKLYTDIDTVKCVYQYQPDESKFPPYFVRLLVLEMAAQLAVALAEDESKMQLFTNLADRQEKKARNKDSQIQPSRSIRDSNHILTQVRR